VCLTEEKHLLTCMLQEGVVEYKVLWDGYGDDAATWEPEHNLEGAATKLQEWKRVKKADVERVAAAATNEAAEQEAEQRASDPLGWSLDQPKRQDVLKQLQWPCRGQTFGSEKLAMKHFQAFNKFSMLRALYRPTRCMCKHEVARHEARAASYGNWYPVR
jgi:hypothetical protein